MRWIVDMWLAPRTVDCRKEKSSETGTGHLLDSFRFCQLTVLVVLPALPFQSLVLVYRHSSPF